MFVGVIKYQIIGNARVDLSNVDHVVPGTPQFFNNLPIGVLVRNQVHATFSEAGKLSAAK